MVLVLTIAQIEAVRALRTTRSDSVEILSTVRRGAIIVALTDRRNELRLIEPNGAVIYDRAIPLH